MMLSSALDDLEAFSQKEEKKEKYVSIRKSESKTKFTEEQEQIIEAKENIIKVNAYAGSGKTFVLENFAKRNIKKRSLYIAFNKDLKLEAEKRFPEIVKCMTMHGLAFSRFGSNLTNKLNKSIYYHHVYDFGVEKPNPLIEDVYAKAVLNTVYNFTFSKEQEIGKYHLDLTEINILLKSLIEDGKEANADIIKNIKTSKIISDANLIWQNMVDPESEIGTTHDCYLKLMQLASPKLPYHTILLDEAQDVNPAMLDLFEKQHTRKLLTGDPYQSIYQFRKAVDAMTLSYADRTYYLTKSFRFGQSIADIANTVISLRGESKPLFGLETVKSDIELYNSKTVKDRLIKFPTRAVITRTNAKIFEEAVKYSGMGFKVYFEGGQSMVRFDLLEDLFAMYNNLPPKDGFLKNFYENYDKNGSRAFDALKEFSKENEISDWIFRCKIVEKYKDNLTYTIQALKENIVEEKQDNAIIITNVHKSKGLEYDAVVLSDDFDLSFLLLNVKSNDKKLKTVNFLQHEAVNLLYVAMTRAKHLLIVDEEVLYHANNVNQYLNNSLLVNDLSLLNMVNYHKNLMPTLDESYERTIREMKGYLNLKKK